LGLKGPPGRGGRKKEKEKQKAAKHIKRAKTGFWD